MSPPSILEKSDSFVWKYCRMCALELKQGVFIFGEEGKRLQIPEKIRKTVSILVLEEDSLPKKICTDCCSSLEDYSQYKDTVLDAQEKLTSIARNFERSQEQSLLQLQVKQQQGTLFRKISKPLALPPPPSPESPQFEDTIENSPSFENHHHDEIPDSPEADILPEPISNINKDRTESSSPSEKTLAITLDKPQQPKTQPSPPKGDGSPPLNYSDVPKQASTSTAITSELNDSSSGDGEWSLKCGTCGISVENRNHLISHHQMKHSSPEKKVPVYGCPLCPRISENYNALRIHIYRHRKEGSHKCSECDKLFSLKDQLDRHVLAVHNPGGKAFSCKECGKRFAAKCSLVVHLTSKHASSKERDSREETVNENGLSKEEAVCLQQETQESMTMTFSSETTEVQHEVEIESSENISQVDTRETVTMDLSGLQSQKENNNTELQSPNTNTEINNSSVVQNVLKVKRKEENNKVEEGTWKCECCDKIFMTLNGYKGHVATHKGKRFECEHCSATFTQKASLMHHITSTHNQAPKEFRCEICNKEFITAKLLRRHKRLHTEQLNDSKCPVCEKVYKSDMRLKTHMKIHTVTKNFTCSTCGKSFFNQHKLTNHENTHSGARPYLCKKCNFYAARSSGPYYRHIKTCKGKVHVVKNKSQSPNNQISSDVQPLEHPPSSIGNSGIQTPVLEDLSTKSPQKLQQSPPCTTTTLISLGSGHSPNNNQIQSFNSHHSENQSQSINSSQHSHIIMHSHQPHQSQSSSQQQQQIWTSVNGSVHVVGNGKSYQNSSSSGSNAPPSTTSASINGIDVVDCAIQHTLTCEDLSPHHSHSSSHQTSHGHNYSNQNQHSGHLLHTSNNNNNNNLSHATFVSSTNSSSSSTLSLINTNNSSHNQPHQSEPMELSYKLQIDNSGFQDMPMELTKVFQRDPLELCVRQDFNPLMDLSSRVNGNSSDPNGVNINSMHMSMVNNNNNNNGMNGMNMGGYHKLDLAERELSFNDLSGAFRQPIDLIARTDDSSHELCSEGSLVDLSLRSSFVQDQSASSFLRELIDLSARSDSFHGELNLTNKHNQGSHSLQQQHQQHIHTQHHGHSVKSTGSNGNHHNHHHNSTGTLQNVIYQDAMFSL